MHQHFLRFANGASNTVMTLSGTPVKSKTPLFVEGTGATGDQQGASVKPGVALRGSMHQPSRTLGAALSAAGYSERWLAALLNAGCLLYTSDAADE